MGVGCWNILLDLGDRLRIIARVVTDRFFCVDVSVEQS